MSMRWVLTGTLIAGLALAAAAAGVGETGPEMMTVTVPAGTELAITLDSRATSDASAPGDEVGATLTQPIVVEGRTVVPAGASLAGEVTRAQPSGKIKGRASLAIRFTSVDIDGDRHAIDTTAIGRTAKATKGEDAAKIGIGAGAGALVGALAGGKKGAAIGSAVGGGAGTGVVLATAGDEVEFAPGQRFTTRLTRALAIEIPRS
ncbi:MAG: hypothetical protein AB7O67_11790 [Vicinamibacterales bacterium]